MMVESRKDSFSAEYCLDGSSGDAVRTSFRWPVQTRAALDQTLTSNFQREFRRVRRQQLSAVTSLFHLLLASISGFRKKAQR